MVIDKRSCTCCRVHGVPLSTVNARLGGSDAYA